MGFSKLFSHFLVLNFFSKKKKKKRKKKKKIKKNNFFSTKKWPKIFSKFFEKIVNFPDLPLDFFKKYFFWSYQLLWIFFWRKLRCIWPWFKESVMCYYIASYLKSEFCRPGGVFWPFLDPREAKKGKKKVNRQTPDKKNYHKKKLTNAGYVAEKKSWLYDN